MFICGCSNNRLQKLENHVSLFISEQEPNTQFTLVLDTISSFKWDELLIAGPYTHLDDIKGYNLKRFPNSIKHHDSFNFIGFIDNNKGVKWIQIKRNLISEIIKGGYKIYSKSDCKFNLEK